MMIDDSRLTTLPMLASLLFACAAPGLAAEESFSHADWTAVLERFVDDRGRVDYRGLSRDRETFDRYVQAVEARSPKSDPELFASREQALAYYLNAYNALVFKGVISRGPEEKSVWRGLVSGLSFFVLMKIQVGGETTSLKSLEDDVVRAEFEDPRIHAALNCASIGCPRLPQEAFVPERLEEQLDAAMTEFVNSSEHCQVDSGRGKVKLSKIFKWFEGDFLTYERSQGNGDPRLLDYVNRFRPADGQIPRDFDVSFLPYDKGVNKQ